MKHIWTILLLLAIPVIVNCQTNYYLIIGTYTRGNSEGIYVYKMNTETGDVSYVNKAAASNPSYLDVSPDEKFVYAVNEDASDKGSVSVFSFDKTNGTLKYIDKQTSGGDHPAYVAVNKTGKWVAVANYTGGSFSTLPIMANGTLGVPATIQHTGSSVNKERQEKPHVHSTVFSPDDKYIFVPDLGIDKVMIYSFNPGSGKPEPAAVPFAAAPPGSGPRHFTFHPNGKLAYLVEEMGGEVSGYKYNNGKLSLIQRISTYPADFKYKKWSADIHISPDGKFLYASNRAPDSIAIFSINSKSGKLTPIATVSTLGEIPRNFTIDPTGNFLLVANQETNNIVVFRRNKETGLLTDTGKRIEVGKPVCLKWIKF
ncbi:3-carboxymuconate cyclase [Niastella yeongjuensis]|uniref:3-carboxymuconate cyclase n=1 Tax=Niastella yeongjuensis TaxID=354355 RepID=A0A1V9F2K6_9BACT|nr:lactonase family protein [Niastella yeongjuensis]OQP52569.1 3-carboxymuconate cyclase [Niastella yeongjuensis]SEP34277.1 6-phosphogluconolactonase [Niastella yeongjuensis]